MRSCFSVALNEVCTNPLCVLLCSEGDSGPNTIVAYYESEFDVPPPQQASLDEAIDSMQPPEGGKGRFLLKPTDALSVNDIVSQGLTAYRFTQISFLQGCSSRTTFKVFFKSNYY